MAKLNLAALKQKAAESSVEVATEVALLPENTYLCSQGLFSLTYKEGTDKKKGQPSAQLRFTVNVTDPILEELNLPVRRLNIRLQTSWGNEAETFTMMQVQSEEDGTSLPYGLDFSQNPRFGSIFARLFHHYGLMEGTIDKPIMPENSPIKAAIYNKGFDEAAEAMYGEDAPQYAKNSKGAVVEQEFLNPYVLVDHQINGINELLKTYDKEHPIIFEAAIGVVKDDFFGREINVITELSMKTSSGESVRLY